VLNPKTYKSPSGEYELRVDPSTKYGEGEGHYRMLRGGAEVWAKNFPSHSGTPPLRTMGRPRVTPSPKKPTRRTSPSLTPRASYVWTTPCNGPAGVDAVRASTDA